MGWLSKIVPQPGLITEIADTGELPKRAIPFIWQFVRALKPSLLAVSLCWGLAQAIVTFESTFIGQIVGALTDRDGASALWWIAAYVVVGQIVMRGLWQVGHYIENHYLPLITMLARRRLSTYLYGHSYGYFQNDMSGRLAGKVIEMPNAVSETIVETIGTAQLVLIQASLSIIIFSFLDYRFGIVAFCFYLLSALNLRRHMPELSRRSAAAASAINTMRGSYIDSISNILLVKLFARSRHENERLGQSMMQAAKLKTAEQRYFTTIWRSQHILNAALQTGIVIFCYLGWRDGTMDVAKVATALPLSAQMAGNIWWAASVATNYFARFATIQEGLDTIIQDHAVIDKTMASGWQPARGSIDIRNVHFAYPERPIFSGLTLTIPDGQKVGLIGPSGAGKSTLVQLLLRLHDVERGQILIDGQDITRISQDDLRRAIAMLPQQADLMHRTIADNIRYGRLDAADHEVERAARLAQAHDFIMKLPETYQSMVGERGVKLSGGQRQRLAIARAFLKDAPILILDEPTSALDSESERLIQQGLVELMAGRTAVVVAHRLSTIAHLDRIIVLDQGRVAEDGTHAELLAKGGLYARLWRMQSEGFIG